MSAFHLVAALIGLAAVFSFANYKLLRLPTAIGLTALTLGASVALLVVAAVAPGVERGVASVVAGIDLNQVLLHGLLGFLLFAGALHLNACQLIEHKWVILVLSSVGVALSTVLVAVLIWGVLALLGVEARFGYCLVFGALISPTDPVAVLGILRAAGVPKDLEVQIAGESLFNDGVGVVVFLGVLPFAARGDQFDVGHAAGLFLREAVGGAAFGLGVGYVAYRMFRVTDDYQVEVLLSLAVAAGVYALADVLHLSAPIAAVVAGLLIGNQGRALAMSPTTVERLDQFWELADEFLNAVLFVLIGLEVLVIGFTTRTLAAGLLAIPAVLLARAVSVAVPLVLLRRGGRLGRLTVPVLTWGGLRGGISVALALSLPAVVDGRPVPERDVIVVMTYVVVVFSILVQGLTVGRLARRLAGHGTGGDAGPPVAAPESPSAVGSAG